jgi:hypothetical protein
MSRRPSTRFSAALAVVVGLLGVLVTTGGMVANAASTNPHPDYLLNIIGVESGKTADMTDSQRRTIFVDLNGPSKIELIAGDFEVIDGNATKGSPAVFALPDPDEDNDGILDGAYTVSVRPLGTPGGKVTIATCADLLDLELEESLSGRNRKSVLDPDAYCTLDEFDVELERKRGKSDWGDVTEELLTIAFEINIHDADGIIIGTEVVTIPLFDSRLEGEFWEYNNDGMRLVQVRFTLNS